MYVLILALYLALCIALRIALYEALCIALTVKAASPYM